MSGDGGDTRLPKLMEEIGQVRQLLNFPENMDETLIKQRSELQKHYANLSDLFYQLQREVGASTRASALVSELKMLVGNVCTVYREAGRILGKKSVTNAAKSAAFSLENIERKFSDLASLQAQPPCRCASISASHDDINSSLKLKTCPGSPQGSSTSTCSRLLRSCFLATMSFAVFACAWGGVKILYQNESIQLSVPFVNLTQTASELPGCIILWLRENNFTLWNNVLE